MKTRSAKNKGKRLQNEIRYLILQYFPELTEDDVKSTTMGESGVDIQLSSYAKKLFPFSTECKNQEKISIWECLKQCEENTHENTDPVLFFKRNYTKAYAVINAELFIKLIAKLSKS